VGGRGDINPKGLEYYNNIIDDLTDHGNGSDIQTETYCNMKESL